MRLKYFLNSFFNSFYFFIDEIDHRLETEIVAIEIVQETEAEKDHVRESKYWHCFSFEPFKKKKPDSSPLSF